MMHTELATRLLELCRANGWTLVTAESCTGGLLAGAITAIAGSSDVFDRGYVTYSYRAKITDLGIPPGLLHSVGAVSEDVAKAMADGALKASAADLSVAITGVAGPGASEAKPEGLVWFAVASTGNDTRATCRQFGAIGRANVRSESVKTALKLAIAAA